MRNKTKLLIAGSFWATGLLLPTTSSIAQSSIVNPADVTKTAEKPEIDEDKENTITVTGSRIPRPETSGVLPGVQVSAEQIQTRGFTSALDIINDLPLIGPGASPNGTNGGQSASLGAAFPDILDLGTQRTLTLVNGRRFVSGNAASLFVAGNASGSQVDLNAIPSALIARTDVLTVGGAAAYGSDAIAGVINVILRTDLDGIIVSGISGISQKGDAANYQISGVAGKNLLDGRLNIAISGEYTRTDGLQADQRDDRLRRTGGINNFGNGAIRNTAFAPAVIDINGSNNGAFLRSFDDKVPGLLYAEGIVNQGISFNGSVFNTLAAPSVPYVPVTAAGATRIALANGIGASGLSFFNTALQIIPGTPFAGYSAAVNNGRAGRTTAIANIPLTTFAPSSLPAGVTAAQVFARFGITPPAGATTSQLTLLAVNVLQSKRPTAREFFQANPNVPTNYFLGSFFPGATRVANTDTTLVSIAGVQVPVNQVLPFVAVPLELSENGNFNVVTAASLTPNTPSTLGASLGSTNGFRRSIENLVLRTQQDRYIGNLNANFEIANGITLFTENLYSDVTTVSLRNSPSQNFLTTGAENAALVLNVNNPFLDSGDLQVLNSVGINAATRGGSFVISRQNQDIFGNNPQESRVKTYRLVAGIRGEGEAFGRDFTAELSATYGSAKQRTQTTQINDIEYQLALDSAKDVNGNIVCRARLFPGQYLGQTPTGTVSNIVRQAGADGIPTDQNFTPTITQDMIDRCAPLNPFGYGQMSAESKAYVRQDNEIRNKSTQTFLLATLTSSLFDLPAGALGVSVNAEYRRDELKFSTDPLNRLGRGRAAPSAQTQGSIEAYEAGAELRIPIFGDDFVPELGALEFNPAFRVSRQTGRSEKYRNFQNQVIEPRFNGDSSTIWSLAGSWRPQPFLTLRGNITRSIRQPSIVELFLGGQPAFSAPGDPCGATSQGPVPAIRLANCRADVVRRGLAADTASADSFLNGFVANAGALAGTFNGSVGLRPETAKSFTYGAIFEPSFLPGFSLTADYFSIRLKDQVIPTGLNQVLTSCYDDPDSDTTNIFGINTCNSFTRGADFQVQSGYSAQFVNLGVTQLRALNIVGSYKFDLPKNIGKITIRTNAYHLKDFDISSIGDFSDIVRTAGTPARPSWELQNSIRFDNDKVFTQLTWNWVSKTQTFSDGFVNPGIVATLDDASDLEQPAYSLFDLTVGAKIQDKMTLRLIISNLANKRYYDEISRGNYIDNIGRRFQLSASMNF